MTTKVDETILDVTKDYIVNDLTITGDLTYGDAGGTIEDLLPPVGTVVPLLTGYFTNSSNGGYTQVIASPPDPWRHCNGSALNDSDSPIWNAGGRYLPNITNDTFTMGTGGVGSTGGQNSVTLTTSTIPGHTHTYTHSHSLTGTLGSSLSQAHTHAFPVYTYVVVHASISMGYPWTGTVNATGTSGSSVSLNHRHSISSSTSSVYNLNTANQGSNTPFDNRPVYLSAKYYVRIK